MFRIRWNCGLHYFKSEHDLLTDAISVFISHKKLHAAACSRRGIGFILDRNLNQIVYPVRFAAQEKADPPR
jgi:hypothetical protein